MSEPPTDRVPTPPPRQTASRPRHHTRRSTAPVARIVAQALLVVVGLSTVALGFSWFVDAYDEALAYRVAPVCGAPATAPGADCTGHETGRVTGRRTDSNGDSTTYDLTVSRETVPAATYSVTEGLYESLENGVNVDLTLWRGRVVELSHQGHRSAVQSTPWLTALKLALLVGTGTVLAVYGLLLRRLASWALPVAVLPFLILFTVIGSITLITAQWPFALTLAIPLIGWLLLAAITTTMSWDY
ncbi:hypothetical protein ACFU6K_07470 [Kitasatospora sp. NPDC057512]|uniref:hypothetical protein n=1 Tax=Kitasatospora sp. NPDC057512 TaxID=3346154 RepID=UPI0036C44AD5